MLQERYASKNEAADLRRAFNTLDINGDGQIDADELAETFNRLRHKAKKVGLLQVCSCPLSVGETPSFHALNNGLQRMLFVLV